MTVSVIIPTHNRAELLTRAIKSVLCQTRPAKEIIVVSDGHDEETDRVMQNFIEEYGCVHYKSYNRSRDHLITNGIFE